MEAATVEIEDEAGKSVDPPSIPPTTGTEKANGSLELETQSLSSSLGESSGALPACSSGQTTDPGSLPVSGSSILAATESVMEKLAAADVSVTCHTFLKVLISNVRLDFSQHRVFKLSTFYLTSTSSSCKLVSGYHPAQNWAFHWVS